MWIDLQEGTNDKVVHNTINAVLDKLKQARALLEAEQGKVGKESNLLMVSTD